MVMVIELDSYSLRPVEAMTLQRVRTTLAVSQATKTRGRPSGERVRVVFRQKIPDQVGHAAFLTDMIVDLGSEPHLARHVTRNSFLHQLRGENSR